MTKSKTKHCRVIARILLGIAVILFLALLWAGIEQQMILNHPAGKLIASVLIVVVVMISIGGLVKFHDCGDI